MSKYYDASLVQIPSGYKAGTLYSVLPANGDGDFDFTRASIATRVNAEGLIETVASGVPRLNYEILNGAVQSCPALLLEPARTNLLTYSEELDNAAWVKANVTVSANSTVSPDGNSTSDKIVESTSTSGHIVYQTEATTAQQYSFSVFVKEAGRSKVRLRFDNASFLRYVDFDLTNVLLLGSTNATGFIEKLPNGWFRCSIVVTATATTFYSVLALLNDSGSDSYTGDGVSGVHLWGAQVEAGSYATSYIPTSGSTVARAAEVCNGAGTSAEFNDSEGVLFAEMENIDGFLSISDGTTNNRITIGRESGQTKRLFLTQSGGTIQTYSNSTDWSVNALDKVLISYKLNDVKIYVNGFLIAIDTSYSLPSSLNQLSLTSGAGSGNFYGKTKQLIAFDAALTDEQLEDLTSWDSFEELAASQFYTLY